MRKLLGIVLLLLAASTVQAQATINWGTAHQTMQGFGAGNNFIGTSMNAYDTLFFNTLGYSLLRSAIPLSNGVCDGSPSSGCATAQDSVTDMQSCVANGCKVWVYVSNPPGEYNSSGTFNCTVNPALAPGSYGPFATYATNYVASLRTFESVPPYAISVQNEPDNTSACQMSAAQFDTFIKTNLGPTMSSAGQASTLIMMPETEAFSGYTSWAGTCMGDAPCAAYVGINAFHDYGNAASVSNPYSKQFWETEVSDIGSPSPVAPGCAGNTWCPTISDALMWATIVSNYITDGVNAWHYFWYVDNDSTYGANANVALVNPSQSTPIALRTYAIANWAKFVRPGWVDVGVSYSGSLLVTAFKNPAGTNGAVVVVNSTSSAVSGQVFNVGTIMGSSVIPWITSSTQNLASQSSVSVSGGTFSYTIPAFSIVTFQGSGGSSSVYYVDAITGNDANSGASTSSPWKHAPGMRGLTPSGSSTGDGCTSLCASTVITPGTTIVMKGGTVWPYTTAPWVFTPSGSGSTSQYGCAGTGCVYIGSATGAGLPAWNNGVVASIRLLHDLGGWDPASPPTISCSGGGGTGAAATAHIIPASVTDPNIAGFIYHITLTSGGSGYTSAPTCTLSGSGNGATLQADIDSPVFDLGATQGSPPDWPWGQCGSFPTTCNPGLSINGNYVIVGDVEVRNVELQNTTRGGTSDGNTEPMVGMSGNNDTFLSGYVHGMQVDCVVVGSCAANGDVNQFAIAMNAPYEEVNGTVYENGDFVVVGNGGLNICAANQICEWGAMGVETAFFTNAGPASVHGVSSFSNSWSLRFFGQDAAGSDPFLNYNSDMWLTLATVNTSAHQNGRYSQLTNATTLYSYNNYIHNQYNGTSNQMQCQSGTNYYYFNEVTWDLGGGTYNYSIGNGGDAGGCQAYIYNDTMYNQDANVCVNDAATATITLQNNHCIMAVASNPYWAASTSTYKNFAGSTTPLNVQAASTVQTLTAANGQGYTAANQWVPTASSNSTVTFASGAGTANLTSICVGNLLPLCSDILGNARPTTGGWQAGSYTFASSPPPPPLNLVPTIVPFL